VQSSSSCGSRILAAAYSVARNELERDQSFEEDPALPGVFKPIKQLRKISKRFFGVEKV
jgi:hypothetical protein